MRLDLPFRGSEAVEAGAVTPGRLRGPSFVALGPDVYVSAGVEVDRLLRARAALLRHPDGAVSGTSAAALWGAADAVADIGHTQDAPLEVLVPAAGVRSRHGLTIRRAHLARDEVREWADAEGGPCVVRVTSPARTLLDVSRWSATVDAVVVGDALIRRRGLVPADVLALAERHAGERGMARVRPALALCHPGGSSPRRTRVRLGVVLAGQTAPRVDVVLRDAAGQEVGALDLAWPEVRCGVLIDRDPATVSARRDGPVASGWTVLSTGREGAQDVDEMVEEIALMLRHADRLLWRTVWNGLARPQRRRRPPRIF